MCKCHLVAEEDRSFVTATSVEDGKLVKKGKHIYYKIYGMLACITDEGESYTSGIPDDFMVEVLPIGTVVVLTQE